MKFQGVEFVGDQKGKTNQNQKEYLFYSYLDSLFKWWVKPFNVNVSKGNIVYISTIELKGSRKL